jgi:hypothetical protein
MPEYDLDDLLDKLNEVAADSDADDDDDRDPDDDDSRDPNDDDWNREQGEDGEQDDGTDDDDGDYSGRRSVMLLEKLNSDADCWTLDRSIAQRIAKATQPKKPFSKADQNMNKISALRQKTSKINFEMETHKLLATATKDHQEASVACYLTNLTPAERREHDEEMRRMAHYYSGICEEVSPDWREQATAAFRSKRV